MVTASDNFCNDRKVINLNHHWTIEDFPSYLTVWEQRRSVLMLGFLFLSLSWSACDLTDVAGYLLPSPGLQFVGGLFVVCVLSAVIAYFCHVPGVVWFSLCFAVGASVPTVECCPLLPYFHWLALASSSGSSNYNVASTGILDTSTSCRVVFLTAIV